MRKKVIIIIAFAIILAGVGNILYKNVKDVEASEIEGNILFQDDFENYTIDAFPHPPWDLWFSGQGSQYQEIVDTVSVSGNKSLKLLGAYYWSAVAGRPITLFTKIGYEVMVRVENRGNISHTIADMGFAKKLSYGWWAWGHVCFHNDGYIKARGQILQTYEVDTWYKVRVIFNTLTNTYSVWINDVLKGSNIPNEHPAEGITSFAVASGWAEQICYFDDVKVFEVYDEWPMFRKSPDGTAYSDGDAPDTNNVEWIYDAGFSITSSPSVANGKVFFGTHEGVAYCLDAFTGNLIWRKRLTDDYIYWAPAIYNGTIFIRTTDTLYCLYENNGTVKWKYKFSLLPNFFGSAPIIDNEKVFVTFSNTTSWAPPVSSYNLCCFNADTGDIIWQISSSTESLYDISVADEKIFIVYNIPPTSTRIEARNKTTGSFIWSNTTANFVMANKPAVADGKVFVFAPGDFYGNKEVAIYAFDMDTGSLIWKNPYWSYVYPRTGFSSPAIGYNKIFFAKDTHIYAFNISDGSFVWKFDVGKQLQAGSSPIVADGKVFFGAPNNYVYALNASTSVIEWSYLATAKLHSTPALAYGRLYIGSNDGKLYCFGDKIAPNPVILSVQSVSSHNITLSWSQNTDPDFNRYEIYISDKAFISNDQLNSSTLVAVITSQNITNYTITNLYSSTTYHFVIRVVDNEGLWRLSNEESGTTLQGTVVDNTTDLIVPHKVIYEIYGNRTYSHSVIIDGILKIKPYNGSADTGVLILQAPTIIINDTGWINADASGYPGGLGGAGSPPNHGGIGGSGGMGPGGGSSGANGENSPGDGAHGGAGGGGGGAGSYGGLGGKGGNGGPRYYTTSRAAGGNAGCVYGNDSDYVLLLGSGAGAGGGGGGGGTAFGVEPATAGLSGENGEPGGGCITLIGNTIKIYGSVTANGGKGGDGGTGGNSAYAGDRAGGGAGGGGAGGSGGTIIINCSHLVVDGKISATGGRGGKGGLGGFYAWHITRTPKGSDGAEGGGGRIKIFYKTINITGTIDAGNGTVYFEQIAPTNIPPVAIIKAPSWGIAGKEIVFNASLSYDIDGYIVNYTWYFGDGSIGYGMICGHVYSNEGNYTVMLKVTDNDGCYAINSTNISIYKCKLDQEQSSFYRGISFYGSLKLAQSFKPSMPILCKIELYIKKIGNPGNLTLYLKDAINGNVIAKAVKNADEISSSYTWVEFCFDAINVSVATPYYIVLHADGNRYNHYSWGFSYPNPYANGKAYIYRGRWVGISYIDFCFKTYGINLP